MASIQYQTNFGESIFILGSIPELGNWRQLVCQMTWTEGHHWKTVINLPYNICEFEYKFVCYNENTKEIKWEDRSNRKYVGNTSIMFSIVQETSWGESIYIMGDIPELGDWTDLVCKLDWNSGHCWKRLYTLPLNIKTFKFKFVFYNEFTNQLRWEEGENRVFSKPLSEYEFLTCSWNS